MDILHGEHCPGPRYFYNTVTQGEGCLHHFQTDLNPQDKGQKKGLKNYGYLSPHQFPFFPSVLFTCHLLHSSAASSSEQSIAPWGSDLAPPPCKHQGCFIRKCSLNYGLPPLSFSSSFPSPSPNVNICKHSTAGERVCFLKQDLRAVAHGSADACHDLGLFWFLALP